MWVDEAWQWILDAHDDPATALPAWASLPALSRISVSSTTTWRPFATMNERRTWPDQIKPFNFLLVADIDPAGYPPGVDPCRDRFRLVAPFSDDPERWPRLEWRNLYDPDGPSYRITTDRNAPVEPHLVIVKDYEMVLREHRLHPEHKFHAADGARGGRLTRGVLHRRPVRLGQLRLIGKEANKLDDVQSGVVAQLDDVLNTYDDPGEDVLEQLVLPVLDRYSGRELARLLGVNRRTVDRVRRGATPRQGQRTALIRLACDVARPDLLRARAIPLGSPHELSSRALLRSWRAVFRKAAD